MARETESLPAWLDEYLPARGPCGICGGPDARHRIVDAVVGCVRAGDSIAFTAANYELPVVVVERLVLEMKP